MAHKRKNRNFSNQKQISLSNVFPLVPSDIQLLSVAEKGKRKKELNTDSLLRYRMECAAIKRDTLNGYLTDEERHDYNKDQTCYLILQVCYPEEKKTNSINQVQRVNWVSIPLVSAPNNLLTIRVHVQVFNSLFQCLPIHDIVQIIERYIVGSGLIPVKISKEQVLAQINQFNVSDFFPKRKSKNVSEKIAPQETEKKGKWYYVYGKERESNFYATFLTANSERTYSLIIQEDRVTLFDDPSTNYRNKGEEGPETI